MQGVRVFTSTKDGEHGDCSESDECEGSCGAEADAYSDLFINKNHGESILYIGRTEVAGKDPLSIAVDGPTVTIRGKGCDGERILGK
jgi:hypothetical protein